MIKKSFSLFLLPLLVLGLSLITLPLQAADQTAPAVLAPETFAVLAKKISAAVVNISTEKVMKRPA